MKRLLAIWLVLIAAATTAQGQAFVNMTACYLTGSATACFNPVNVASGGTGLASGTSGGIPAYTGSTTIASSGPLTANAVVIGGGAGAVPTIVTNNSTATNEFLTQSSNGTPAWAALLAGDIPNISASKITSGTLAVPQGGTGVGSVTTAPAATSFAGWDSNKNLSANSHIDGYTTTATAAGTTTLNVGSTLQQFFTGSTTQTVVLPVTSTLVLGQVFKVYNNSSGVVTVQSSGGNTVQAMAANSTATFTVILTSGTTAASWNVQYSSSTTATVTSVSFADSGGIFSNTGSPVTTSGTLTENVTGTSGGIPYFNSTSQLSSSNVLTNHAVVTGGGAGATPVVVTNNASGTKEFLTQSSSNAPAWATIQAADVPAATTGANGGITLKAPTQQKFTSGSGTYTTPAGVLWIRVRMVGGGGGGGGSGTAAGTAATNGGATTFGTTLLSAGGGNAGTGASSGVGGAGGAASLGTGPTGLAIPGAQGGGATLSEAITTSPAAGGMGGVSALGGAGTFGGAGASGNGGTTNSGSGGGGGGGTNVAGNCYGGGGGGAGAFVDAIIGSPSATYSYAVGAGGSGGAAGTSGNGGGNGAAGIILVEEHYY